MPDEKPESPREVKALFGEIRADEHAARVRDYGEADAATYDQRVRDGSGTTRHLEADPAPVSPAEIEGAVAEIERSSYDSFLRDATERAMTRMQGKGDEHER